MNPSVFKAYDIRGLAPQEIDEVMARRLGKVLSELFQPKRVLVGCDMRLTSPALERALIDGFVASGVQVTRIGLCSTPVFNVSVGLGAGHYDLGVMVTASHNPGIYNGFKLVHGDCQPIGQGSGMEAIRERMLSDTPLIDAKVQGSVEGVGDAIERYIEHVYALAKMPATLPAGSLVADAGNGMNGIVLPKLVAKLRPMDVYQLYWDLDGSFPHHEANPLKVETLNDLMHAVAKHQSMFGVAFDGDADRVGFVDEQGAAIPGDILTALLATELLQEKKGATILYDLRSSWSVPELIREAGGTPVMCKVGHAHIKRQMRETGAAFAGELSMHFYFADTWNVESGEYALLLLLKKMVREKKPLSALWKPLRRYVHSGEINFPVTGRPAEVMSRIEGVYAKQATDVSHLDGVRMEFRSEGASAGDWWFSVRTSNTEPLIRLVLEARSEEVMQQHKKEMTKLIQG